jgi:hypothetical protein
MGAKIPMLQLFSSSNKLLSSGSDEQEANNRIQQENSL